MEQLIISTYIAGETSLRDVAGICGTNHHTVKRVLIKNNMTQQDWNLIKENIEEYLI